MAHNKQTEHDGRMSNTIRATNQSISSCIGEQVLPMLDSWENEIKKIKELNTKVYEDIRIKLLNILSRMAEGTKQLQSTCGDPGYRCGYKEKPQASRLSEHIITMTTEWKKHCKHIKKNKSARQREVPDQNQRLAELVSEMQGQVQYWMESFEFTADISEKQLKQLQYSTQMLTFLEELEELQGVRQNRGNLNIRRSNSDSKRQTPSKPTGNKTMVQRQTEQQQPVPLSGECADLLKQLRKASAPAFVAEKQTRFLKDRQAKVKLPEKSIANFYNERAEITWYMNVQTPPLALAPKPTRGTPVKTDMYSLYTESGVTVDYVVWPACLLHEKGPLLTKGIVQPLKPERVKGAQVAI